MCDEQRQKRKRKHSTPNKKGKSPASWEPNSSLNRQLEKSFERSEKPEKLFWGNGSLQIDHLGDPLSVWGKSQTLHYIAAQPTRLSVVLFVKSKIFKRQFLPTFATRFKLSSHKCLKSRHSRCWDPGLVHQHFPLVSVIVVRYSRPRQRPRKIHFGIFARPNLIITPKQDSTEPLLVGGLV